jgi:hypothetical protein
MSDNSGITTSLIFKGTYDQDGQTRTGDDAADYVDADGRPVAAVFGNPPNTQATVRTNPDVGPSQQSTWAKPISQRGK